MLNIVDPDETAHYEPSHLDLCCLQKTIIFAYGSERVKPKSMDNCLISPKHIYCNEALLKITNKICFRRTIRKKMFCTLLLSEAMEL